MGLLDKIKIISPEQRTIKDIKATREALVMAGDDSSMGHWDRLEKHFHYVGHKTQYRNFLEEKGGDTAPINEALAVEIGRANDAVSSAKKHLKSVAPVVGKQGFLSSLLNKKGTLTPQNIVDQREAASNTQIG